VIRALLALRWSFRNSRHFLKRIGEEAGVGIEPDEQVRWAGFWYSLLSVCFLFAFCLFSV
jgi:hypothetical protein